MLDATNSEAVHETIRGVTPEEHRRMKAWLEGRIEAGHKKRLAEAVTLTPCLAQLIMLCNPINRPIGRANLENIKSDIANNRWEYNGESISISNKGKLLNGQHRCAAVIETGTPIETVIAFGAKDEARYTIDIGSPKSAANFLHMKDFTDTNNLAATVSLLLQYKKHGVLATSGSQRPTKTEIVQAAETYRGVQSSVDFVRAATKKRLGSRSVLAFCHYTFWKKTNKETADEFMHALIEGDGLRKTSPIHYCRERLIGMGREVRADSRSEVIFKCWNAWRRGEHISKRITLTGRLPKVEG